MNNFLVLPGTLHVITHIMCNRLFHRASIILREILIDIHKK